MNSQSLNSASTHRLIAGVYLHFKDEASEVLTRISMGMESVMTGAVHHLPNIESIKRESKRLHEEVVNTGVPEIETMVRQFDHFIQKLSKITVHDARVINEWMDRLRRSISRLCDSV